MKSSFSRDNLILLIGLGSGVLGIILGFWDFVQDISNGQFGLSWLFIYIFISIFVYRLITKQTIIYPIVPSERTSSIKQTLDQLENVTDAYKVNVFRNCYPSLPDDLSGEEAAKLLGSLDAPYRVNAIEVLAPKLASKVTRNDKLVLGPLKDSYRVQASRYLSKSKFR